MPEAEVACGTAALGDGDDLRQITIGSERTLGLVVVALSGEWRSSQ